MTDLLRQVHCPACQQKVNAKTGEITYYHQLLGGVLIHPDLPQVIPLMPEPILRLDGEAKNDCERNAAKRFLDQLAFLVDQIQQLGDALFQAALTKAKRRGRLWEKVRTLFTTLDFQSMTDLLQAIAYGYTVTRQAERRGPHRGQATNTSDNS